MDLQESSVEDVLSQESDRKAQGWAITTSATTTNATSANTNNNNNTAATVITRTKADDRTSAPLSSTLHQWLCQLASQVNMSDSLATEEDYRQVIETSISLLSKQTVPLEQHPPASSSSSYPSGRLTKQERAIIEKSKHFEAEILQTLQQVDKKDDWYLKYKRLAGKLQKEKSQHSVLEDFIQSQNKKITVLVDHVEKLMKALKIESAKRLKIIEESRKNEKEDGALQAKIDRQQRIIATQQRALHEVNEGSKVLEDQLKLMDEKYLELRGKLDVTRDHFMKQIKLVKKENGDLRAKYAAMTGGALLDKARPDASRQQHAITAIMEMSSQPPPINTFQAALSDLDALKTFRQNRAKSVDLASQGIALQGNSGGRTPSPVIRTLMTAEQMQMQHNFLGGLKAGLPPPLSAVPSAFGLSAKSACSSQPDTRTASPMATGRAMTPGSPSMRTNRSGVDSRRPKSAATYQEIKNRSMPPSATSARMNERILAHVVRKIERKEGISRKKGGWTADRLLELLEG